MSLPPADTPPPRRRPWRGAAALGVVLVVLALGAVLLAAPRDTDDDPLRAVAPPPAPTPSPTIAEEPAAASPEPTPLPGPPVPGIGDIIEQVAALRGLQPLAAVESRLVSRESLADKISELVFSEIEPGDIEADQRLLAALRLIPADVDLVAVVEELYRAEIIGLYVPEEEALYVRADPEREAMTPYERYTAAHEVAHALQDQHFGLEELRDLPDEEADAALAILSLIEGDAVLTQQLWASTHLDGDDLVSLQVEALAGTGSDAFERAPRYIREALVFPYREGSSFVQALYQEGGFDRVNQAYRSPPTTTAQIYHPQRYLDGVGPVAITTADAPDQGWGDARTYTVGEFDVRELLMPLGHDTATRVGAGWAGGRVSAWDRDGATAVAVALAFDTPADATEACDALPSWWQTAAAGSLEGDGVMRGDRDDVMAWTCGDTEVRFSVAPDTATARHLAAG